MPILSDDGIRTSPCIGLQLAGDQAQQRRLAGAVAADQGQARGGRHVQARALEQGAAGDAEGDVGEVEHGGRLIACAAAMPNPGRLEDETLPGTELARTAAQSASRPGESRRGVHG